MRKLLIIVVAIFIARIGHAQNVNAVCIKINDLNTSVLKGTIKKKDAINQFTKLIEELKTYSTSPENEIWDFPLQGYNYSAIGGTNGNGYYDKGYNYLDGNKHAAHPAHDIFIHDKNQDCIDDRTNKPVDVDVVADGFVIACSNEWDTVSELRGGKYIWIYHSDGTITYYAHNKEIFVKPGDAVKRGQKIAEVGRTGYNAFKKRSPTHLHFSAFHLVNNMPVPYNCFVQLKKAQTT